MKFRLAFRLFLFFAFLLTAHDAIAQVDTVNWPQRGIDAGVGLGTVIAVVASWSRNESILWAILHGFLSWFYVIYFALTRD